MRTGSAVLYDADYKFEFGKGYILRENAKDAAVIISSGRGVIEMASASAAEIAITHLHYTQYGGRTIIIARFVPFVRTYAPGLSGA